MRMVCPSRLGSAMGGKRSPTRGALETVDVMARTDLLDCALHWRVFGQPVHGGEWLAGGFEQVQRSPNNRALETGRAGCAQVLASFVWSKQHARRHDKARRPTVRCDFHSWYAGVLQRASDQSAGLVAAWSNGNQHGRVCATLLHR